MNQKFVFKISILVFKKRKYTWVTQTLLTYFIPSFNFFHINTFILRPTCLLSAKLESLMGITFERSGRSQLYVEPVVVKTQWISLFKQLWKKWKKNEEGKMQGKIS